MLSDRDYMRTDPPGSAGFRPPRPMSATMLLLIINVAAFLIELVLFGYPPHFFQGPPLALRADQVLHGYVWELLTYQLLHGGFLHILLNCWGIFVFGREVEQALGKTTFFILYFASGTVGGLFQVLASVSMAGHFPLSVPVVGASAGVFGLVAAFAMMYPHRTLTILLFFVLPVTLRAKTLLLISGAIAVVGMLFPQVSHIAHAAHLGGMLTGMFFIRQLRHRWGHWPGDYPRSRRGRLFGFGSGRPSKPGSSTVIDVHEVEPDEFVSREVDPILEKISAHGIHSLTARERKTLEEARRKMGR